jgi:hypothetical protein
MIAHNAFAPNPTDMPLPLGLLSGKISTTHPVMRKGGCREGVRSKSVQLGNKLRVILGLPPVDFHPRLPNVIVASTLPRMSSFDTLIDSYFSSHER